MNKASTDKGSGSGIPSNPDPADKEVTNLSVEIVGGNPKLKIEFEEN